MKFESSETVMCVYVFLLLYVWVFFFFFFGGGGGRREKKGKKRTSQTEAVNAVFRWIIKIFSRSLKSCFLPQQGLVQILISLHVASFLFSVAE